MSATVGLRFLKPSYQEGASRVILRLLLKTDGIIRGQSLKLLPGVAISYAGHVPDVVLFNKATKNPRENARAHAHCQRDITENLYSQTTFYFDRECKCTVDYMGVFAGETLVGKLIKQTRNPHAVKSGPGV